MKKLLLISLFAAISVSSAFAAIELQEPVITDNYIEFVGINTAGNYKFTLNSYEWPENHGPQLQITIEPIDASQPAFFSAADLQDENYWEPMFMRVTQQMAGEAMTAQDNIKRLYLGDVQLLENQFTDYEELHIIGFDLKKNYTLPTGCFLNAGHHLETIDVACEGTMTLSPNSLPANKAFEVNVSTQAMYDVWNDYKGNYNCQYTINYNGSAPAITGVSIVATFNGETITTALPATGFERQVINDPAHEFRLNRFDVEVNTEVDEIFMDYAIVKSGTSPSGWSQLHATKVADGTWVADNLNFNVLQGLQDGQTYVLYFDIISGYVEDVRDRLRYDNGGQMYQVEFKYSASSAVPGDVNGDNVCNAADVTALYNWILNNDDRALVNGDQNGDGVINAGDVTYVYNIILGTIPVYDHVYILGEVNGNEWAPNVGVEMTTTNGKIYTARVTTTKNSNYFGFTKALATGENSKWEDIETSRFGAVIPDGYPNDYFDITENYLNTNLPITYDAYNSFHLAAGEFTLTLDLQNMTLKVDGEFTPAPQPSNSWYLVGTINNWSETDMSYPFVSNGDPDVYSIRIDNVSGDFWFKIANGANYELDDFWSGTFLSAAIDGETALSGSLVNGNVGAFCVPSTYNATYLNIIINTNKLTYTIETDGTEPQVDPTAQYDYVYITGDADGWTGNGGKLASVKDENNYYGCFEALNKFKIQKNQNSWAVNWGGSNGNLVSGGNDIPANGFVYLNANLNTMTYNITNITSISIIGDAVEDWNTDTPLTFNSTTDTWEGVVTFKSGLFKFRANSLWDINWGGSLDNLVINGDNIGIKAGTYNVVLKLVCPGEYTATVTPVD